MSTLLEAVAGQIATVASLTAGTNLFAGRMPEVPDHCVAVYEYAGREAHYTMGASTMDRPRFQVICRALGYGQATGDAHTIYAGLDAAGVTWSSISILRCVPISSPTAVGVDEQERSLISVRFEVVTAR